MIWSFLFVALACPAGAKESGPAIGSVAPPIGPCQWFKKEHARTPDVGQFRGQVVLIHTFAVGCAP